MKLLIALCFIVTLYANSSIHKIDDWDTNATKIKTSDNLSTMAMQNRIVYKGLGLSVGGAKDIDNFIQNIKNGYLPKLNSITYEGVFYEHYFDFPKLKCKTLFCPSYSLANIPDIYTNQDEYYMSIGLSSNIDLNKFKRDKLNVAVVLDISGSMRASFSKYYYDSIPYHHRKSKSKMKIATETIVNMFKHLKNDDRLAIVLFDNIAYKVKPFRNIATTDMKAISSHILQVAPRGGTNWSAGYKAALEYFEDIDTDGYQNRIIFITDAMPNMGELDKDKLFGMTKKASKRGIYTTFLGVGVDFNTNLVDYISKVKGANYYSIHSAEEFSKRLDKEFDYMVTPIVYDMVLKLTSDSFQIDKVFGVPNKNTFSEEILNINTLFASDSTDGGTKGGVILIKLKKSSIGDTLKLNISYKDKLGKRYEDNKTIHFDIKGYQDSSIQKAILLTRYVTLMRNWIADSRVWCNNPTQYKERNPVHIMRYIPYNPTAQNLTIWERKSCKLKVTQGYKKLFSFFKTYFVKQMDELNDKSLNKELNIIDLLLEK